MQNRGCVACAWWHTALASTPRLLPGGIEGMQVHAICQKTLDGALDLAPHLPRQAQQAVNRIERKACIRRRHQVRYQRLGGLRLRPLRHEPSGDEGARRGLKIAMELKQGKRGKGRVGAVSLKGLGAGRKNVQVWTTGAKGCTTRHAFFPRALPILNVPAMV